MKNVKTENTKLLDMMAGIIDAARAEAEKYGSTYDKLQVYQAMTLTLMGVIGGAHAALSAIDCGCANDGEAQ